MSSNSDSEKICPRCGRRYSSVRFKRIGGNEYVYIIHYDSGRTSECYVGPRREYIYVSKMHSREGLVLRGMLDDRRVAEYLEELAKYIARTDIKDPEVRARIRWAAIKILRRMGGPPRGLGEWWG